MCNARERRRADSSPYNGAEPLSTEKHQPSEKSGAEQATANGEQSAFWHLNTMFMGFFRHSAPQARGLKAELSKAKAPHFRSSLENPFDSYFKRRSER